jgi:hypothetical protein
VAVQVAKCRDGNSESASISGIMRSNWVGLQLGGHAAVGTCNWGDLQLSSVPVLHLAVCSRAQMQAPQGPHRMQHGHHNLKVRCVQERDGLIASDPKVQAAMRGESDSDSDSVSVGARDRDSAPVGAIVGGTLGGLVVLLLACLALGCLLMRKRRRRRGQAEADPKKVGSDGETALLRSYTLPLGGIVKDGEEGKLPQEKSSSVQSSSMVSCSFILLERSILSLSALSVPEWFCT